MNTCTVTGEAEKKTRKAVRHALSTNDGARVVVTGWRERALVGDLRRYG